MMSVFVCLVACHLIGDYVLQSDFIAKTKGENWYHLFVHSALYCVPFIIMFGLNRGIVFLFGSHMAVDAAKERCHLMPYAADQAWHYFSIWIFWLCGGCV